MVTHLRNCNLQKKVSTLKADSQDLILTHVASADGCVSAEIGNFLFSAQHTSAARVKRSSSE